MFSKIQMQACLQNDQRTSTPRKWRAALEAMREGGLGGSRVSTSGSHRRQKGGFRHSSVVSYPTLLLTEMPPGTWVPGSQAWQQGLEARWEMPLAVQWGSLWACTWVGGTAGEGVPPRPSARPCVPAEWACRCLLCLPHQDLCDPNISAWEGEFLLFNCQGWNTKDPGTSLHLPWIISKQKIKSPDT